jgi:ribosomal protein S25
VAAEVRERLEVSKQVAQQFDVERFKLRKLSEMDIGKQYQIKISNSSAALENLSDSEDINRAWDNIKENIKTRAKESLGLYKLQQHNPWLEKEGSRFLDQRKQDKLQWLWEPNPRNVGNLNNVRREA